MASVEKRGDRFSVRYRDPVTGDNRRRTFMREREAIAFRAQCEVDIGRGCFVSPADGDRRFGEALEEWLVSKRTRKDHATVLLGILASWAIVVQSGARSGGPVAEAIDGVGEVAVPSVWCGGVLVRVVGALPVQMEGGEFPDEFGVAVPRGR